MKLRILDMKHAIVDKKLRVLDVKQEIVETKLQTLDAKHEIVDKTLHPDRMKREPDNAGPDAGGLNPRNRPRFARSRACRAPSSPTVLAVELVRLSGVH